MGVYPILATQVPARIKKISIPANTRMQACRIHTYGCNWCIFYKIIATYIVLMFKKYAHIWWKNSACKLILYWCALEQGASANTNGWSIDRNMAKLCCCTLATFACTISLLLYKRRSINSMHRQKPSIHSIAIKNMGFSVLFDFFFSPSSPLLANEQQVKFINEALCGVGYTTWISKK